MCEFGAVRVVLACGAAWTRGAFCLGADFVLGAAFLLGSWFAAVPAESAREQPTKTAMNVFMVMSPIGLSLFNRFVFGR